LSEFEWLAGCLSRVYVPVVVFNEATHPSPTQPSRPSVSGQNE